MAERIGLVLEGGGVRGIYTAGVLDVFLEHGIAFDGVIGVSAGAIHGCSYLSGQKGRSIRYYRNYVNDPRFMSLRSWLKTGDFVGAEFCYHTLPEQLDVYDNEAFLRCGVPFHVVVTNVETGKAEYPQIHDMVADIHYLRASASLPYASRIVEIGKGKYLDGGCADAIPAEAFLNMGYDRVVTVLTRDAAYVKSAGSSLPARLCYRRFPAFRETLANRHAMYNAQSAHIRQLEAEGTAFVIRPAAPIPVGRLERSPEKVQLAYDQGRADALAALPRLMQFLSR